MDFRARPGLLHLDISELATELELSYDQRRVGSERRGTQTQHNREFLFEPSVFLSLHGDVYDPALLTFESSLRLGVSDERSQQSIGRLGQSDSDSGLLQDYNLFLEFLREKPFSLTAYARSGRDRIPRAFLPSLLDERKEAGIAGHLLLEGWESRFGFEWADIDRSGNREEVDNESLQSHRFFVDNRWELGPEHSLSMSYDHTREENTYGGSPYDFDTSRDELRFDHELAFGPEGKNRLTTFARLNNEDGDLARDEYEIHPLLTLQHTDSFRTDYRYIFYHLDQGQVKTTRHEVGVQGTYQPYDRLRLTSDLFWLREATEHDIEIYQYGGSIDVDFRQPNRWGETSVNLAFEADRERSVGDAEGGAVRGESHVLDSVRPTYLVEPDIWRTTIVAYNVSRTRLFVPGRDYLVVQVGRRTIVYRTLAGRILDGEQVLFDYRYRVPTGSRTDTYRVDARVEHRFATGLTPFCAVDVRRQFSNGSRGRPAFEDNSQRYRLGLRYDQPTWSVTGEAERFHDDVEPYDSVRVSGRVALVRNSRQSSDFSAAAGWFDFDGDDDSRNVAVVDVGVSNRFVLNDYLTGTLGTTYKWENDSEDGETNGVDAQMGLQFRRGLLEVDLTVEYDLLTVGDHDEGVGVWLTVRRDLTHLVANSREAS